MTQPTFYRSAQDRDSGGKSPQHLQTDNPIMEWEDWYSELSKLFADATKRDTLAIQRYINISVVRSWYEDGFTPYVTFRENFNA